jgi:predicted alpha-1,6-mannanase (GH76 family)
VAFHWLFEQSQLQTPEGLFMDGLNAPACQGATWHGATFTYNQGVILGALIEMDVPKELAKHIANAVVLSPKFIRDGVLFEPGEDAPGGCSGGDCPQFKGIFMRNLGALERVLPDEDPDKAVYERFIRTSAEALWQRDRDEAWGVPRFGAHWYGPVSGDLNAATQASAVGALVAAMGQLKGR